MNEFNDNYIRKLIREIIKEEMNNEKTYDISIQVKELWKYLNKFKDDTGKRVRFEINPVQHGRGLTVYIYGNFNY